MPLPSNFDFLTSEFADFAAAAKLAEKAVYPDPHAACFHCRRTLELAVHWLYKFDRTLQQPYDTTLGALLHEPSFQNLLPETLFQKARLIQINGNNAVHGSKPVYQLTALQTLTELHHFLYWLARTYTRKGASGYSQIQFDQKRVPFPSTKASPADREKLKSQEAELDKTATELKKRDQQLANLDQENAKLREQLAEAKATNETSPDPHDYSESDTRKHLIDAELIRSGWNPTGKNVPEYPVTGMPNNTGKGLVDYVLWDDDGKPLAVVEAKRTTVDPKVGQQQAKLYADCLETESGQRPLIFYTNGYTTWFWDDTNYPHRKVAGFYKKEELKRLIIRRDTLLPLDSKLINRDIAGRYYQIRAIASISELFTQRRRKALLVMATGTGKTRTSIALVDLLQRCNWAKNILFLADRVSLVNQATGEFKKQLPESSPVNLVTEKDKHGRVYTCTYPTMMGLIDAHKNGETRFSPGHFDLIVIDEAHRSIYQKYSAIFQYFDSLLVGLTATPREEIDKNTYQLFDIEDGVPTDAYELTTAVNDGFLVPPRAKIIDMKFPREGIAYADLSVEEQAEWESLDWGDEAVIPDQVNAASVNKWLFNKDTIDKVLHQFMANGHKVEAGDRLAKTIIFARNHKHAEFIEERFNYHFPDKAGHFARIIDNYAKYPQSLIDDFSQSGKNPHIAISVDMLDTGIDVPEVANLVFFKPIYSKIKFWQMIGRGTRLCPNLYGPGQHKEDFRVFDFCGNFDFFGENPEGITGTNSESLSTRLFRSRINILAASQTQPSLADSPTLATIRQTLHEHIQAMHPDNFEVRMKREFVERFQSKTFWQQKHISESDLATTSQELATLPTTIEPDQLEARQWDAALLSAQLASVTANAAKLNTLSKTIAKAASKLEEKASIPVVKAQLAFIQAIQDPDFWQSITLDMLEEIRTRLRDLIHLIDKGFQNPVYTDFEDEIQTVRDGEPFSVPTMTGEQYEKKVRAALALSYDHIAIQKLRQAKPLTEQDIEELERMLIAISDSHGKQLLDQLITRSQSPDLVTFIRTCVGMDRQAAQAHFSEFLENQSITSSQIRFIELIISHLAANGTIRPEALYAPPFSSLHAAGPDGIFPDQKILNNIFTKIQTLTAS